MKARPLLKVMNERTHKVISLLLVMACCLLASTERIDAQQATTPQTARVSIKLEREHGGRVSVDNRTTGRITIIGWDRDTVEATATSERGVEAVRVSLKDLPAKIISLKADYLKRPEDDQLRPEAIQPIRTPGSPLELPPVPNELPGKVRSPDISGFEYVEEPPTRDGQPIEVHLEVRVPRYVEIDIIRVIRSPVEVTDVDTSLIVLGQRSPVVLKRVRDVEVRTRSGSVEIEDAAGLVEVVTASGAVRVRRTQGDVRVLSISGNMEIECVRGRVNIDSADGSITLSNIQGDIEANASNSNIQFTGAIREDGRYHLKTMSGSVEMLLRDKPPGFTAALSSYRGSIENDFKLQVKQSGEPRQEGEINRRVFGRYGNGQAQITLDSFDGKVKLAKLPPGVAKECKIQN
jgi:hypothetical protein